MDYDTDGEIENDELPQEFTIKIPSEYHYFDEDADEGDITDVLNEWISTETGFSTKGIVWIEEENNSWRKNAETFEAKSGKRMYCPKCQTNRTWNRGFKKEKMEPDENPYDFVFYTCQKCDYAYDPTTSLEIKDWKTKFGYNAEEKSITPYLLGVGIVGILGYAFRRKLY